MKTKSELIKGVENKLEEYSIKLKDLYRHHRLSYSYKRKLDIHHYERLIENCKNHIKHLNK